VQKLEKKPSGHSQSNAQHFQKLTSILLAKSLSKKLAKNVQIAEQPKKRETDDLHQTIEIVPNPNIRRLRNLVLL